MQIGISFWSRSGADILWTFWAGSFISRLQACILFYRVSDKSATLLLFPCSHRNAVAHIYIYICRTATSWPTSLPPEHRFRAHAHLKTWVPGPPCVWLQKRHFSGELCQKEPPKSQIGHLIVQELCNIKQTLFRAVAIQARTQVHRVLPS